MSCYYGQDVGDKYRPFINHIGKLGFAWLDDGTFRKAYVRDKVLIKVPKNTDGEIDNRVEAAAWRKYKNKAVRGHGGPAPSPVSPIAQWLPHDGGR